MNDRPSKQAPSGTRASIDGDPSLQSQPETDEVREEISATLTALMPWGISILAHVVLVAVAFFLVWQTIVEVDEDQPTVPRVGLDKDPGAPMDLTETVEQQSEGSPAFQPNITPVSKVQPTLPAPGQIQAPFQPLRGVGINGVGKGPGPGEAPGGLFEIVGDPNATRFVYLIDASGSMVDVLPFVITRLKRAVNELDAKHEATIIMFSGEGVFEVPGGKGLRSMTSPFKKQVTDWVTLENHQFDPGGRGTIHVKEALKRALSYNPHAVYLLSDNLTGGGQGATRHELIQDDLLDLIHKHNKARPPAAITTYQFLYEDPLVKAGLKGTLKRIAEETGGEYKFISPSKLHLR